MCLTYSLFILKLIRLDLINKINCNTIPQMMNTLLPLELENIITDYTNQLIMTEKLSKLHLQLINRIENKTIIYSNRYIDTGEYELDYVNQLCIQTKRDNEYFIYLRNFYITEHHKGYKFKFQKEMIYQK